MKQKGRLAKNRQEFLLSFFSDNGYEEKEVNGFWLVKQHNGNTGNWQVAIYSKEAFERYKNPNRSLFIEQDNYIEQISREN